MSYVYKIYGGNIHYTETPIELTMDKISRYSKRLRDMRVMFSVIDNSIILL